MEIGRIIFYNPQTGEGKLILKSKEKFDFSIDVWDDFESPPQTGLLTECSIEDGVVKSIIVSEQSEPASQSNAQETDLIVSSAMQEGMDSRIRSTLENYFKPIDSIIGEPPEVVHTKAQLDYFISRRFLMTAYNNLKNFDASLHDHQAITETLDLIKKLEKAYYSSTDKIDVPKIAFEAIFLRSQPEYLQYISDKERCHDRIAVLTTVLKPLVPEIKKKRLS